MAQVTRRLIAAAAAATLLTGCAAPTFDTAPDPRTRPGPADVVAVFAHGVGPDPDLTTVARAAQVLLRAHPTAVVSFDDPTGPASIAVATGGACTQWTPGHHDQARTWHGHDSVAGHCRPGR